MLRVVKIVLTTYAFEKRKEGAKKGAGKEERDKGGTVGSTSGRDI